MGNSFGVGFGPLQFPLGYAARATILVSPRAPSVEQPHLRRLMGQAVSTEAVGPVHLVEVGQVYFYDFVVHRITTQRRHR